MFQIHLANLGPHERWRELLEWARVPPLNLPNVILSVLLPAFGDQTASSQVDILRYIRDNLSRALDQETAGSKQLERQLRSAPLIRGDDGELHAAAELYSPELREVVSLLGNVAHFPDVAFYPGPQKVWLSFLRSLGLKQIVSATDLVARIDHLIESDPTPRSKRQLIAVFSFIQKHWDELKEQKVKISGTTSETLIS